MKFFGFKNVKNVLNARCPLRSQADFTSVFFERFWGFLSIYGKRKPIFCNFLRLAGVFI